MDLGMYSYNPADISYWIDEVFFLNMILFLIVKTLEGPMKIHSSVIWGDCSVIGVFFNFNYPLLSDFNAWMLKKEEDEGKAQVMIHEALL